MIRTQKYKPENLFDLQEGMPGITADYGINHIGVFLDQNNPFPCRHLPPIPTKKGLILDVEAYCKCNGEVEIPKNSSCDVKIDNKKMPQIFLNKPAVKKNSKGKSIPRYRKNSLPSIVTQLRHILIQLESDSYLVIRSEQKSKKGLHKGKSYRRSRYIGVCKNRSNYQALVNYKMLKKYIGTYRTESEAALMFDFYSIALHGLQKVSTNFTYKAQLLQEMIEDFMVNESIDPLKYVCRVSHQLPGQNVTNPILL